MVIATTTTIMLDPAIEHSVVQQYKKDKEWIKASESTTSVVFKHIWPTYNVEAAYIPISKEGQP